MPMNTAAELGAALDQHDAVTDDAVRTHTRRVRTAVEYDCWSDAVMLLSTAFESAVSAAISRHVTEMAASGGDVAVLADHRLQALEQGEDTFAALIDEAEAYGIIDQEAELLHGLRRERNAYMHGDGCVTRHDVDTDERHDLTAAANLYADMVAGQELGDDSLTGKYVRDDPTAGKHHGIFGPSRHPSRRRPL